MIRSGIDLVADIGATHARFQSCTHGVLQGPVVDLETKAYADATELLAAAHRKLSSHLGSDGVVFDCALLAVAGPQLAPDVVQVTNTGLEMRKDECSAALACPVTLVNDFYALAHAVPYFTKLRQVGGASAGLHTKAVLGPGSGLGMATIVPNQIAMGGQPQSNAAEVQWQVIASEGGHADLAPGSHLEAELWSILLQQHGHVSWETVLCGPGLQNLHVAMCALWGVQEDVKTAAEISAQGQTMADPVCHQTLETFCALLGSAAGNLALTVAATGGVYLAGGILPQMLEFLIDSPFRRRFEERGLMSQFVTPIPVYVILEPQPGLTGAVHCLTRNQLA